MPKLKAPPVEGERQKSVVEIRDRHIEAPHLLD